MIKEDFLARVPTMNTPIIEEFNPIFYRPHTCWIVYDKKNPENGFFTPIVVMKSNENMKQFQERLLIEREKYSKWFNESIDFENIGWGKL